MEHAPSLETGETRHPVHEELGGYEGAKLGMWLFLGTELLLFGVLFCGFAIFHAKFVSEFKLAHHSLDKVMGGLNTIVLIVSSLTVALAIDNIQRGRRKRTIWLLAATIVLACTFLVIKYFEYSGKFHHGIYPGHVANLVKHDPHHEGFQNPFTSTHEYEPVARYVDTEHFNKIEDEKVLAELDAIVSMKGMTDAEKIAKLKEKKAAIIDPKGVNLFFTYYFVMTGVHGLHVIIGATILAIVMVQCAKGQYTHWYYTPVENGGLYWHLVDLIWIYLFPLMYLIK